MLEVVNLVKDYRTLRAVDHLSFRVNAGEIVGLLGPNGAGKTTALRCLCGILRPTSGQILIGGYDILTDQAKAKARMAFVPELPSLYELLTVEEHLKFVAMCFDSLGNFERNGDDILRRYDLIEKKKDLVATLSKGMRQKLSIACAMIHDSRLLLMDEPIIGIDPAGVAEVKAEIHRAKENGCAILISTHLLDTAEKLCDRVMIVARGRLIAQGTLEELRLTSNMAGGGLEEIFLKLTEEVETEASNIPHG